MNYWFLAGGTLLCIYLSVNEREQR